MTTRTTDDIGAAAALSEALADAVEAAGRGVVRVRAGRHVQSGVAWTADGLVVTTAHRLARGHRARPELAVDLPDGGEAAATVVGWDPTTDLALLRAEGAALTVPAWDEAGGLRVGHLVLVLGRPGASVRATHGLVSALGGPWRTPHGGQVDRYVDVDAALPDGFAGGALVTVAGRVVGVNTPGLLRQGATLPTATVRRVVEHLATRGTVRRGYLGVRVTHVRLPDEAARAHGQATALLVSEVEPGSPADGAGLALGDTLLSVDGRPLDAANALVVALSDRVHERVTVRFLRAGEVREAAVTVAGRPGREG